MKLLWGAVVVAAEIVVRVRLANGAISKVRAATVDDVRREAGTDDALYLDEACAVPVDDAATLDDLGVTHGALLYAKRAVVARPRAFDPYPALSRRRKRIARVTSFDELSTDLHEINRPTERVCDTAFVPESVEPDRLIFGSSADQNVDCKAFVTPERAQLASKLGLDPVGCTFRGPMTAECVRRAARLQAQAMESLGATGTFPFAIVVVTDDRDVEVEVFEVSEHFVQMTAEGLVHDGGDRISVSRDVVVAGGLTRTFEAEWVYAPVPVRPSSSLVQAPLDNTGDDRAVVRRAIEDHLHNERGLAERLCDVELLSRLEGLVTRAVFDQVCDIVRDRWNGRITPIPPTLAAVLDHATRRPHEDDDDDAQRIRPAPAAPSSKPPPKKKKKKKKKRTSSWKDPLA